MNDRILVTAEGLEMLVSELEHCRVARASLAEAMADNVAPGDSGGGDGSFHLQIERDWLERRIAVLEQRIGTATVIEPNGNDGLLEIGETVRVRDLATRETLEFRLVGDTEADPADGRISYRSPVGAALIGKGAGAVVEVEVPKGIRRLEIIEVEE